MFSWLSRLFRKKRRRRGVKGGARGVEGPMRVGESAVALPDPLTAPGPQYASIPAKPIKVQGTYGRNAVEPLPRRGKRRFKLF